MDTVPEFSWAAGERWIELRYWLVMEECCVRYCIDLYLDVFRSLFIGNLKISVPLLARDSISYRCIEIEISYRILVIFDLVSNFRTDSGNNSWRQRTRDARKTPYRLRWPGKISIICGRIKEEVDPMEWCVAVTGKITVTCGHRDFLRALIAPMDFYNYCNDVIRYHP